MIRYAVFHHCTDKTPTGGGYVVRTVEVIDNDYGYEVRPTDARNYGGIAPVSRPYKRKFNAQILADKLNAPAA